MDKSGDQIKYELQNISIVTDNLSSELLDAYNVYNGFEGKDVFLIRKLEERRNAHKIAATKYKKNEGIFTKIFYAFGFLQVISTVIATTLSGSGGISNTSDTISISAFWVGLVTAVLGTITIFFRMEERSSRHHMASGQYADIAEDLGSDLNRDNDIRTLEGYTNLYNEKEKFINGYEPNCSSSFMVACLSGKPQKRLPHIANPPKEKNDFLVNKLREELCMYKYMSALHAANDTMYGHLFLFFSTPQILLTVVMSIITGLGGFTDLSDNSYVMGAFGFSVCAAILSAIRSVFKFQKTASLHHSASSQNSDLSKDLKTKLRIGFSDRDDIQDTIDNAVVQKRFINSYAPSLTWPLRG